MGRIRALVNGSKAVLLTPTEDLPLNGFCVGDNFDAMFFLHGCSDHPDDPDPWLDAAFRKGFITTGATLTDEMLLPREALHRRTFFRDVMVPLCLERICTTVINADAGQGLPLTMLSVFRGLGAESFNEEERRALAILSPHLRQALRLAHTFETHESRCTGLGSAIDALRVGVALLDRAGRVVMLNERARQCCGPGAGLKLARDGETSYVMRASLRREDAALQHAIATAIEVESGRAPSGVGHALMLHGESDATAVRVSVCPALTSPGWFASVPRAAVVLILERPFEAAVPSAEILQSTFGFTAAESRVAQALCGRLRPKKIAEQAGVSEATVRTHIRSLLKKTGCAEIGALKAKLAVLGKNR